MKRRSQQVWEAKKNLERGRVLTFAVMQARTKFVELSYKDQQLVEDFDAGKLDKKLEALLPPALSLEASSSAAPPALNPSGGTSGGAEQPGSQC